MVVRLLILFLALTLTGQVIGLNDATRQEGAKGDKVVEATVLQIRENCFFPHDHLFLRRLAYVLTQDGKDPKTYRSGYNGGIWQVDRDKFIRTQSSNYVPPTLAPSTSHQHPLSTNAATQKAFNIQWDKVTWNDLRKPLYSAIAAGLYILSISPNHEFPVSVTEQAALYQRVYGGSTSNFLNKIKDLDKKCESESLDIVFVLDASGSIDPSDFEIAKNFTAEVISRFDVGPDAVRVSLISYSSDVTYHFNFTDHTSTLSAKRAALAIPKISGGTSTWLALDAASNLFSNSSTRDGVAKVAVVATDGQSNLIRTNASAELLRKHDVIVFAIGIGNGVNQEELYNIASKPKCMHMREPRSFTELMPMISDIKQESCKASAVQKEGSNNTYSCLKDNSFNLQVQDGHSVVIRPENGEVRIYGSFSTSLPSEALSDFNSIAKQGKPVVIFVKNSEGTIALTVTSSMNTTGECQTTYELIVYPKNMLDFQIEDLCVQNSTGGNCSLTKILEGHVISNLPSNHDGTPITSGPGASVLDNLLKNNGSNPGMVLPGTNSSITLGRKCPGKAPGVYPNPNSTNSFITCLEAGEVLIIPCDEGMEYDDTTEACTKIKPIDVHTNHADPSIICKMCSDKNWRYGLRNFALPNNHTGYIACTYIGRCEVRNCDLDKLWNQDEQMCLKPSIPLIDILDKPTTRSYPCDHKQTVEIMPHYKSSIKIQPASGTVEIYGSFTNNLPSASSHYFKTTATSTTPAILYARDATNNLYLTFDDVSGACLGFIHVTTVDGNALHKFGATNMCFFQHVEVKCTAFDFLEKYNYREYTVVNGLISSLNVQSPCTQDGVDSFHEYPYSTAHFVYCEWKGRVLEVDCPTGQQYLQAAEDCVLETHVDSQHPCLSCHSDNWHLNIRKFKYALDDTKFINCTGINVCQVKACPRGGTWSDKYGGCAGGITPSTPVPPTGQPIQFVCSQGGTFHSFANDPSKYIRCNADGHAVLVTCQPDHEWNSLIRACMPVFKEPVG